MKKRTLSEMNLLLTSGIKFPEKYKCKFIAITYNKTIKKWSFKFLRWGFEFRITKTALTPQGKKVSKYSHRGEFGSIEGVKFIVGGDKDNARNIN